MPTISAKAMGKVILFGEHGVVHGYTAVAAPIELYSHCTISTAHATSHFFDLPDFQRKWHFSDPLQLLKQIEPQFRQFAIILEHFSEPLQGSRDSIQITLSSDLWPGAGLGSSASTSVALIRGCLAFFSENKSLTEIDSWAFECEKIVHGTPSGIDNTVITSERPIVYKQGTIAELNVKAEIPLLITFSGEAHDTKSAVGQVRNFLQIDPEGTHRIFRSIEQTAMDGIEALQRGDLYGIGTYFDQNHAFLRALQLSSPKLEQIREITQSCGVFGTKLTGAGLGGATISVGSSPALLAAQQSLQEAGFESRIIKIRRC